MTHGWRRTHGRCRDTQTAHKAPSRHWQVTGVKMGSESYEDGARKSRQQGGGVLSGQTIILHGSYGSSGAPSLKVCVEALVL